MEPKSRKRKYRNNRILFVLAAVAAAALLLSGGLLFMKYGSKKEYDANAIRSDMVERPLTKEAMRKQIQQAADASSFRFLMNAEPIVKTLENGEQVGEFGIINSVENGADMEVVITLEDGTEVYHVACLKPGQQDLNGTLINKLPEGSYEATAVAYALDKGSGDAIGMVSTELTLQVISKTSTDEKKMTKEQEISISGENQEG